MVSTFVRYNRTKESASSKSELLSTVSYALQRGMAKDVWVRGIIDIGVVGSERAYVLDWKTGKHRPDSDQLKLFAALTFALYPWIESVVTDFIWLKAGKFDKEVFTRAQLPEIWNDFSPRLERLACISRKR